MLKLNILILDFEHVFSDALEKACRQCNIKANIACYAPHSIVEAYQYDIVFIHYDTMYPQVDDMVMIKQIDPIVFFMSHNDKEDIMFDLVKYDFLFLEHLEPYLTMLLKRIILQLEKEHSTIPIEKQLEICMKDIYYIECNGNYLIFGTRLKEYQKRGTLKKIRNVLSSSFFQCNSRTYINVKMVDTLDAQKGCVTLLNRRQIIVSKAKIKSLMTQISQND